MNMFENIHDPVKRAIAISDWKDNFEYVDEEPSFNNYPVVKKGGKKRHIKKKNKAFEEAIFNYLEKEETSNI